MNKFEMYKSSSNDNSVYKNIPIELLEEFKTYKKETKLRFHRIIFRGPRQFETYTNRLTGNKRKYFSASTLKKDATHFSVYPIKEWNWCESKGWIITNKG